MSFLSDFRDSLEDPLDLFGGRANRRATDIQTMLSQQGLDLQRSLFEQLFGDQAPVRAARDEALGLLNSLQDGTFQPFTDPSLNFRKEEGLRKIRQEAAFGGKLNSGDRYIGEQDLTAGLESEAVNNAVQRILNLAGFSTSDLTQTNPVLQANIAGQGQGLLQMGDIRARGIAGQANARNSALNSGFGLLGYYNPGGFF